MPTRRSGPVFRAQGEKLRYLLFELGDRRAPDPRKPDYVKDAWLQDGTQARLVRSQTMLADELRDDEARVSAWFNDRTRIPDRHLASLCPIFGIDEIAFRVLSFAQFKVYTETGVVEPVWARWRRFVRAFAQSDRIDLLLDDPDAPVARDGPVRHARIVIGDDLAALPTVSPAAPFWLAIHSPQDEDDWAWSGWHLLVLSHDDRTDAYACILLPATCRPEHGALTFPAERRTLCLPRGPVLQHAADDRGRFTLIVVLTREPLPFGVLQPLSQEAAHGLVIEPALQKLATWLMDALGQDAAAVCTRSYRVAEPRVGAATGP